MPWAQAGSLINRWLPDDACPEDIKLKDPSHLHKQQCIRLMLLWQGMDEVEPDGFRFTGWITDVGTPSTAKYKKYIKSWKKDAPVREDRKRMLAEYKASEVNGKGTPGKSQPSRVQQPPLNNPPQRRPTRFRTSCPMYRLRQKHSGRQRKQEGGRRSKPLPRRRTGRARARRERSSLSQPSRM